MELDNYREKAIETASSDIERSDRLNKCVLGLEGEFWEMVESLKKDQDWTEIMLEAGDCEWYLEMLFVALDEDRLSSYPVMEIMLKKLEFTKDTFDGDDELLQVHLTNLMSIGTGRIAERTKKIRYHGDDFDKHQVDMIGAARMIDAVLNEWYGLWNEFNRGKIREMNIDKLHHQDRDFDSFTSE